MHAYRSLRKNDRISSKRTLKSYEARPPTHRQVPSVLFGGKTSLPRNATYKRQNTFRNDAEKVETGRKRSQGTHQINSTGFAISA